MQLDMYGNAITPNTKDLLPETLEKAMPNTRGDEEKKSPEVVRRRGQWFSNYGPIINNVGRLSGTLRKPSDTPPFMMLRQVAKDSLIDRAIIDRRVEDIKGLAQTKSMCRGNKGDGASYISVLTTRGLMLVTKILHDAAGKWKIYYDKPNRLYHKTFRDFLTVAVQEELVIDRRAMVITRDGKGRPTDFYLLPGDTVLPVLYVLMPWMMKKGLTNERVARMMMTEELSQKAGMSIDITEAAYVQEVDGQVVGAWKRMKWMLNTQTHQEN
jgi:hypothetical protein